MTRSGSCWRRIVLDALLNIDWSGREIKAEQGGQLGDWCNARGDRRWWFGSDRKSRSGKKRSDPGHIWKVKPRGFPARLNVVHERKKEVRDGLSNGKNGIVSSAMGGDQVSGQRTGIQFRICQASDEMRHSNRDVEWQLDK